MNNWNKKWDSLYWLSLILVCLSLAGWFGYRLKKERLASIERIINWQEKLNSYSSALQELSHIRTLELMSEQYQLLNITVIDSLHNQIHLKDLINKETLVFRFWEGSCAPCLDDNFNSIKVGNFSSKILLGTFVSFSSYKTFINKHRLDNTYMIQHSPNQCPMEEWEMLYYFTTNKDLKLSRVLVPLKGYHPYAKAYLEKVGEWVQ
jgi:hypothetical protein